MKKGVVLVVFLMLSWAACFGRVGQALRPADRLRLAEAFRLADAVQDSVWPGWHSVPFAVLLVEGESEFLIRHPSPSPDFLPLGYDSLLRSAVWVRPRRFSPQLLATFPAVGPLATVVVGTPEQTGKSSTMWVLTLLHEHFHQLQNGQADYYAGVEALNLSGGDQTGMWMMNYPFPYDSTKVAQAFLAYRDALQSALHALGTSRFKQQNQAVAAARERLRQQLSAPDYRYLAFQVWQEGVARYTELRVAQAARRYQPLPAFAQLPDFMPYPQAADTLRQLIHKELKNMQLASWKRVVFYPVGAAEALLLDAAEPEWRKRYFEQKFELAARAPQR